MQKVAFEEHFGTPELMYLRKEMLQKQGLVMNLPPAELEKTTRLACDVYDYRIPAMDECEINISVLQGASNGLEGIEDPQRALDEARKFNDNLASVISKNPDRFKGLAVIPMQTPEAAAKELERCIKEYGFIGAAIAGWIITNDDFIDEDKYNCIFETAERYNTMLYLHPTETPQYHQALYRNRAVLNGPTWSWGVDTGTYVLRMIFSGLFDKYPNTNLLAGHMGEMLPYCLWRLDNRYNIAKFDAKCEQIPSEYFKKNIYITTSGNLSSSAMKCAIDAIGSERILFAIDYPFEPMQVASKLIDDMDISESDKENICYKNSKRLLH